MSKLDRLKKLGETVIKQQGASKDRFDRADITLAIAATAGESIATAVRLSSVPTAISEPPAAGVKERLRILNIDDVKDHPRNARKLYDPTRVDDLAKSLVRDDQKIPAIVFADESEPGKFILIDGRYRKRALSSLGRTTIMVFEVDPVTEIDAYRLSRVLNEERTQQTDLDNALSWREMLDDKVFESQNHISIYLELSEATVSKTLALLDLPNSVMAIMKTNPSMFGIRIGYELRMLAKQITERELEAIAERINDGKLTVAEVEAMREKREKKPTHRERSRAYPLKVGGNNLGKMREFDDGRLNIELAGASESLRTAVKEAVQKVLEDEALRLPSVD